MVEELTKPLLVKEEDEYTKPKLEQFVKDFQAKMNLVDDYKGAMEFPDQIYDHDWPDFSRCGSIDPFPFGVLCEVMENDDKGLFVESQIVDGSIQDIIFQNRHIRDMQSLEIKLDDTMYTAYYMLVDETKSIEDQINSSINGFLTKTEPSLQVYLIPPGTFELKQPINIKGSGIAIIGTTTIKGERLTTLKATWKTEDPIFVVGGPSWGKELVTTPVEKIGRVGQHQVTVHADDSVYPPGQSVKLVLGITKTMINDLGCAGLSGWENMNLVMDRCVAQSKQNKDGSLTLTLDDDIVFERWKSTWGTWMLTSYKDVRNKRIFISGLNLTCGVTSAIDENHAKIAIECNRVKNVRVVNVVTTKLQGLINVSRSCRWIEVIGCACNDPASVIGPKRRYAYDINGTNCVVYGCTADNSRHAFVSNAFAMGPNVFSCCSATNEHDVSGPHQRLSCGFLYDNMADTTIRVVHLYTDGTGHGMAGAFHFVWNCKGKVSLQSLVDNHGLTFLPNYGFYCPKFGTYPYPSKGLPDAYHYHPEDKPPTMSIYNWQRDPKSSWNTYYKKQRYA